MIFIWSCLLIFNIKFYGIQSLDQGCIARPRDIVIVLDSSDNVSKQEFESSKIAVVNFLSYFPISPEATRVSLLGFGVKTKMDFNFTKYSSPPGMNFAIRLHNKIGGGSVLGEALDFTLNNIVPNMRETGKIDRILLLVSNGKNSGLPLTNLVAAKLKDKNVMIYTVGIGSGINTTELKEISSDDYVILFPDFQTMQTDFKKLINVICTIEYVTNTPFKSQSTKKTVSFTKAQNPTGNFSSKCSVIIRDVVFVLDASESISETDFQLAQQFITRMITFLKASNNRNRIALVLFGDSADIVFDFSKYDSIDVMIKNVNAIRNHHGLTAIGKALNLTWVELFPKMRTDVERLIVLLTDGTNNKYPAPQIYADKLKDAGVKILTIGIGSDINKKELDTLATKGLLVLFTSFTDLLNGQHRIIKQICPITEPDGNICNNPELNLIILISTSLSLSDIQLEREKSLVLNILNKLTSTRATGYISVGFYAENLDFSFFVHLSQSDVVRRLVSNIKSLSTYSEINNITKTLKDAEMYFKSRARYHMLLISAGTNIITPKSFEIADNYKADGIKIITVGVGSDDYSNEMKALSSNGKFLVGNSPDEIEEISEIVYRMFTSGHLMCVT